MANYIPGMASGLDWTSIVTQLMQLEQRPITLMENRKEEINERYDAWKEINTKLLSLKTAAQSLSGIDDFDLFTSASTITGTSNDVDDFLSFTIGSNASQGSYTIKIDNLAQAQKLGSKSFNSLSDALGISGDLVINGRTITIASSNSLNDIRNKINSLNSGENPAGVTASIITVGNGEYRLNLTSQNTGSKGIDISNGSSTNVLGLLGLADNTVSLKSTITGGTQSSNFTGSTQSIKTLMGLSSAATGSVTIAGESIDIDLSADSLQTIKDKINENVNLQSQNVSASVISVTDSGTTYYRLQIDGTQSLTDSENILQTLGFLKQGLSDVSGVTSSGKNTADGKTITKDTFLIDIDGYNTWAEGDTITIQGVSHSGAGISPTSFTINADSTMEDLLDAIEAAYGGEVSAYVNGDGSIVVEDNQAGSSSLALTLTANLSSESSVLNFGTFDTSNIRKRQITAGEDAQITLDGTTIIRSTNQITDVIAGVTLNLFKEDTDAEITLDVTRDINGIKNKISDFVSKYNEIITYINDQFEYSEEESATAPLFGDSSLMTVRSTLRSVILSAVNGIGSTYDHLSLIGINSDKTGKLSIDNTKLDGYLRSNFSDVVSLFTAQGSSTNSNLSFISSSSATQEGTYEIEVTQVASKATTSGTGFSGTLSEDAVISITDNWGRQATIELSAGWNITSIANAINSELSESLEEIQVGENRYYADDLQGSVINNETILNNIYDGTGASAGLANGDMINIIGTDRGGNEIKGSFTITDVSTETVGDLLNNIEDLYGTGYDAYIDSQGRVAIKDTIAGDTSLTLSIQAVKNLDFGNIDVDPSGADGSQKGRYSIDIIAENDNGQLKISNKDYGNYNFSVSVTGGNLGVTDGTYTGNDVTGRIRKEGSSEWMTVTGSGQSLSVDDDQDAEGLVVNYTGTGIGTFDFSFTTGVSEKMDRSLFYMTDSLTGYISRKQTSLQDQMNSINLKIEAIEKRISKKEEALVSQFVLMEKLVAQLQSQQSSINSLISSMTNS